MLTTTIALALFAPTLPLRRLSRFIFIRHAVVRWFEVSAHTVAKIVHTESRVEALFVA